MVAAQEQRVERVSASPPIYYRHVKQTITLTCCYLIQPLYVMSLIHSSWTLATSFLKKLESVLSLALILALSRHHCWSLGVLGGWDDMVSNWIDNCSSFKAAEDKGN